MTVDNVVNNVKKVIEKKIPEKKEKDKKTKNVENELGKALNGKAPYTDNDEIAKKVIEGVKKIDKDDAFNGVANYAFDVSISTEEAKKFFDKAQKTATSTDPETRKKEKNNYKGDDVLTGFEARKRMLEIKKENKGKTEQELVKTNKEYAFLHYFSPRYAGQKAIKKEDLDTLAAMDGDKSNLTGIDRLTKRIKNLPNGIDGHVPGFTWVNIKDGKIVGGAQSDLGGKAVDVVGDFFSGVGSGSRTSTTAIPHRKQSNIKARNTITPAQIQNPQNSEISQLENNSLIKALMQMFGVNSIEEFLQNEKAVPLLLIIIQLMNNVTAQQGAQTTAGIY